MIPFRKLSPRFVIYGKLKKFLKLKKVNLVKKCNFKEAKIWLHNQSKIIQVDYQGRFSNNPVYKRYDCFIKSTRGQSELFLGQPSLRISPKKF